MEKDEWMVLVETDDEWSLGDYPRNLQKMIVMVLSKPVLLLVMIMMKVWMKTRMMTWNWMKDYV